MFICLECHQEFNTPKRWTEKHGLDTPPYEEFIGCPYCSGNYTEAYQCSCCGEWITDDYIKIDDDRYCDGCYIKYTIGEE